MAGRAAASAGDSALISLCAQWGLPQVEKSSLAQPRSHSPNLVLETGHPRYATLRSSPCRVRRSPPSAAGVRKGGGKEGGLMWRDSECG